MRKGGERWNWKISGSKQEIELGGTLHQSMILYYHTNRVLATKIREVNHLSIGDNIRTYRVQRGMSQADLAKKLHISPAAVAWWEIGRNTPSTINLLRLADLFGCSMDELLGHRKGQSPQVHEHRRAP